MVAEIEGPSRKSMHCSEDSDFDLADALSLINIMEYGYMELVGVSR